MGTLRAAAATRYFGQCPHAPLPPTPLTQHAYGAEDVGMPEAELLEYAASLDTANRASEQELRK